MVMSLTGPDRPNNQKRREMADLTQTAANVAAGGESTRISMIQVGEAVTQGQPGYFDSSDRKYYIADANNASKYVAKVIFLTPATTDGYAVAATSGPVNLGATLTVGVIYVVSDTAGSIMPSSDLSSGDYVTILGVATSTSLITLNPSSSSVVTP